MVPFAGYEMPVQYEGIMAEHLWMRENAGLFDVSHMGQILFHGSQVDAALETLLPGELKLLGDMKLRYSMLLDRGRHDPRRPDGHAPRRGILRRRQRRDQARRHRDFRESLPRSTVMDHMKGQALLALQGRKAVEVLERLAPGVAELGFMQGGPFRVVGHPAGSAAPAIPARTGSRFPSLRAPLETHRRLAGGR